MILVKSLIALFLILVGLYAYDHLHLLSYFDGREGFAGASASASASEAGTSASQGASEAGASAADPIPEEVKFTTPSPLDTHKKMSADAENLNNLQNKVTELFKLKDKAIDITKNLL
jgi:hypothetical protein